MGRGCRGFTGGYKKHNPIFVILFVILTFSAVMNMTPLEQPTLRGIFATEGLADNFLTAVERGAHLDLARRVRRVAPSGCAPNSKPIRRRAIGANGRPNSALRANARSECRRPSTG